ncbi:MAG: hypothetical protein WAN65_23005 [Candidatus Sulfotelmatobacter sp.]
MKIASAIVMVVAAMGFYVAVTTPRGPTTSLQRSYIDDNDKRQYTGSLSLGDLPNAIRVLQLAQACIVPSRWPFPKLIQ